MHPKDSPNLFRTPSILVAAGVAIALAPAAAIAASLAYRRTATSAIVVAHIDGSGARLIAHGVEPFISPDGRLVAFGVGAYPKEQLRTIPSHGGRIHTLARQVFLSRFSPPVSWSADSRFLIVGEATSGGAVVIDLRRHRRRTLSLDGFGGGAFDPLTDWLIVDNAAPHASELVLVRPFKASQRLLGSGSSPSWGRAGLAYSSGESIAFRQTPSGRDQILMNGSQITPVGWSRNGEQLLLSEKAGSASFRAAVIDIRTRATTTLAPRFSRVDALSADGTRVLGEANGNVIAAATNGTVAVLARGADSASWNF